MKTISARGETDGFRNLVFSAGALFVAPTADERTLLTAHIEVTRSSWVFGRDFGTLDGALRAVWVVCGDVNAGFGRFPYADHYAVVKSGRLVFRSQNENAVFRYFLRYLKSVGAAMPVQSAPKIRAKRRPVAEMV